VHAPLEHRCPAAQAMPQPPQFCGSVWVLVQNAPAPEPQGLGVADGQAHEPLVHSWPTGQVTPQPPQLSGSLPVVAQ
jgi:hypothetical protein